MSPNANRRIIRPALRSVGAAAAASSYQINGLDAHDGKIVQVDGTYYLYGTRYGRGSSSACANSGFFWRQSGTPWCGFGVWSSTDKINWTFQRMLFDPLSANPASPIAPGESWQVTCGFGGAGCFNPRMVQRASDGVWILWFNAPGDYNRIGANAYYAMGCAGPAGPCGPGAGPRGSVHKPNLWTVYGNGDFDLVNDGANGVYIVGTMADQTLSVEQLDVWWTNGVKGVGKSRIGALTSVESPSVFRAGPYLYLTYSSPNCAFCSSDGTGWARSANGMLGTWTPGGLLSSQSCTGQPRTLNFLDGVPYEWIDQWTPSGAPNQAIANIHLEGVHLDSNGNLLPFGC